MSLQPLPVPSKKYATSFQVTLNGLSTLLSPRVPLYLILRRQNKLVAITFVPYLAQESQRTFFMEHRHRVVQLLGENNFSQSLICKEIGEVVDARSWTERDEAESPLRIPAKHVGYVEACNNDSCEECTVQDIGYRRNRCRLCDRRMMNKIDPDALDTLTSLRESGIIVQLVCITFLCMRPSITKSFSLLLLPRKHSVSTSRSHKRHPNMCQNCFPRLRHRSHSIVTRTPRCSTMAIPGLLVHAEDAGIRVDQKIEIHNPDDLVFEEAKDERVDRFRSMYRRDGFDGAELTYEGMVRDKEFLDAL
jgi:twinfilin-like protein